MTLADRISALNSAAAGDRQNYSYTGLYSYAKRIARTPPVNVHISKLGYKPTRSSTELLDALSTAEAMPEGQERDAEVERATNAIYSDENAPLGMARRHLKSTKAESATINWSGTICDMTAYSIMCIGAGVARIERLNSNDPAAPGDRLVEVADGPSCSDHLNDWMNVKAPGVIQLKFDANGMHTFAVEKICAREGGSLSFRIYQSYQGKYRLSDFLGLSSRSDLVVDNNIGQQNALTQAANKFGNGKRLSEDEFSAEFAPVLVGMVGDGTGSLGELIGVASVAGSPVARTADKILLAMCDRIDPTKFQANYEGLISGVGVHGGFVELDAAGGGLA
ncbi:MAG: hypothetical protein AAGM33_11860, partial [Pseudomonadota bacterium]